MSEVVAQGEVKEIVFEAVVIRADGTREDLGEISYWHKSPIKRYIHRMRKKING